ncbi:hypothetical protein [Pseudomonas asiatica]|uniref:hypothetical protein n=1 Tax=Pseudomonas asiatica TaxID=2219225 RepID=UPI0010C0258A|nr:hypothetical protein [Pseudomonas asiatica]HBO6968103.1 hypothetical protein [Pseudomonas aeruginosa]HBO6968227.1 hypothetical protein [Pseudomonas aeruginosa]
MPAIRRVVPNENWQLIIEFEGEGHRLFPASIAREEKGFQFLAYPDKLKNLTFSPEAICWGERGSLGAGYLFQKSTPVSDEALKNQLLRVSYMNQAPTPTHSTHHVYGVYIFPFNVGEPFSLGESIGGGHGEMGGSRGFSLEGLLSYPEWKMHFELSGCAWAIGVVESYAPDVSAVLDQLVREICRREGEGGGAQKERSLLSRIFGARS